MSLFPDSTFGDDDQRAVQCSPLQTFPREARPRGGLALQQGTQEQFRQLLLQHNTRQQYEINILLREERKIHCVIYYTD